MNQNNNPKWIGLFLSGLGVNIIGWGLNRKLQGAGNDFMLGSVQGVSIGLLLLSIYQVKKAVG